MKKHNDMYANRKNSIYVFVFISSLFMLNTTVFAQDYTSSSFRISNPTFDSGGTHLATSSSFQMSGSMGQIAPSSGTSTNFSGESGFEYFDEFTPVSQNWRWYDDETNETPTSPLEDENVSPSDVSNNNTIKLRVTLNNQTNVAGTDTKLRLQYSEYSDFSQDVYFVTEQGECTGNSLWCYADGIDNDNDTLLSTVLSDATATGTHNEAGTSTTSFDISGSESTEFEFTIKSDGPRVNTTYYFRLYNASISEAIPLGPSESYPSLVTAGANLSFTISGLNAGTDTEGITTDATTSPTSVTFGDVPFNIETEAAQRIQVTTNATEGYQLFVFEQQGLVHSNGEQIDPISTTNASPGTWLVGCVGGAIGCYGYHTGDDTLAGGSTRFSVDNTYAQFESSPREIAHSALPVDNEIVDVVYKVQVSDDQVGGLYESSIVYIITPVF